MTAMTSTIQNYIYGPDRFSKPKRNFIRENMKHLKKIQPITKERSLFTKTNIDRKKLMFNNKIKASKRYASGDSQELASETSKFEMPVTPETEVQHSRYKNQGCQTSPDYRAAYKDGGTIIYASQRAETPPTPRGKRNMCLQIDSSSQPMLHTDTARSASEIPTREDGKVDYIKLNALLPIKKKVPAEKPDPTKAPPQYQKGVLPKYIRNVKKQQIQEMRDKGMVEICDDPNCPPDHVLLSDEEKKKYLKELRTAYADLVAELNMVPLKSDSLKNKTRRISIEKSLQKLEDGIKLLSREKLYVQLTD